MRGRSPSDMDRMAQSLEGRLQKAFALGRVSMDSCGDVLETRARLERQAEDGRQFRNAGTHSLNTQQKMIVDSGHDADEAFISFQCHGPTVGLETKEPDFDLNAGGLGLFG